jgi:hypothetical protein
MNGIRPTFINVGPGRCGTSWLLEMLEQHPEVQLSRIKETEYFNSNYDRGEAWYLEHFAQSGKAVGEISNMYYVDENVAARIHAFDPEMRIIFNLRRPESLLESIAGFGVRRGFDPGDPGFFETPIGRVMGSGYDNRLATGSLNRGDTVQMADAACMSRFLQPYIDLFGKDRVYFLVFERIASEPEALLRELFAFLGVDPGFTPANAENVVNAAMTPKAKWIGALATRTSYFLRKIGAYGMLKQLHKSRLIKKLLYSPPQEKGEAQKIVVPQAVRERMAREQNRLIEMFPVLKDYWS